MINNFDIIKDKLNFINERSMYFVQILKRKKENPEQTSYTRPIESFYIFSIEQFERMLPHIIDKCETNRARAYIKMNCLDAESVMLENISVITQEIRKGNWHAISKTLNSACGKSGKQNGQEKLYLVDLDNISIGSDKYNEIVGCINSLNGFNIDNRVYMSTPTKNGCHIISYGFDIKKFKDIYPDIDVHEDGITLLYFPSCCD